MSDAVLSWHLRRPTPPDWARRLDIQAARMTRFDVPAWARHGLAVLIVLAGLIGFLCRREAAPEREQAQRPQVRLPSWVRPALTWTARRIVGRRLRRALLWMVGSAALTVAVAYGLTALPRLLPPPAVRPAGPPPAAWREIVKPVRIWSLESPEFAGAPLDYTARAHVIGGGREDVMTLGRFAGDGPALRLRLFRRSVERPMTTPLAQALSAEAAQLGLAPGGSGKPVLVPTRYGQLETANIRIARTPNGVPAACTGFRLNRERPALSVTGLFCGRRTTAMSREAVGCLVERLDVASARDDRELIDFVAASELKRNAACAGMRLRPDTLHAPWLDDKPDASQALQEASFQTPFVSARGKTATGHRGSRRR